MNINNFERQIFRVTGLISTKKYSTKNFLNKNFLTKNYSTKKLLNQNSNKKHYYEMKKHSIDKYSSQTSTKNIIDQKNSTKF